MKGWLDNYNDSKVSLPEGFVGMGNDTKGRNYSPAWGGQFADGGNMRYYQQGLDFEPKSISKNGMTASADATKVNRPPIDYNAINIAKHLSEQARLDEMQPTATIGPRSDNRYSPGEPQFLPDLGTRMLNAVETFGGSAVADAVQGISPQAAGWLDKYSGGMFSPTSEEQLEEGRSDNPDRWLNRAGMTADAASSVLAGELLGAGMQKGAGKIVDKAIGSADLRDVPRLAKNAIRNIRKTVDPKFHKEAAAQLERGNKYLRDWYTDPATIKKFRNTNMEHAEETLHRLGISPWEEGIMEHVNKSVDERVANFVDRIAKGNADVQHSTPLKNILNKVLTGEGPTVSKGALGTSWTFPGTLESKNYVRKYLGPYQRANTMVHEASHGADAAGNLFNPRDIELLEGPFNLNRRIDGSYQNYLLEPTEIRARKQQILYSEKATPETRFTADDIDTIIEKGKSGEYRIDPQWFDMINSPNNFRKMMNDMWGTVPAAVGIGAAASQQKRNGGKAKEGAALQLDKLDQLTNFTNYNKPTRGGWLNKYK